MKMTIYNFLLPKPGDSTRNGRRMIFENIVAKTKENPYVFATRNIIELWLPFFCRG